jgi:glycosyltransferase involved in cell wall biosynthesis
LKVSIITVSYQSAATLRQTIESVLAQDYTNKEYWVIDGGSTDGSLEILKSFGSANHRKYNVVVLKCY